MRSDPKDDDRESPASRVPLRAVFWGVVAGLAVAGAFVFGVYSGYTKNLVARQLVHWQQIVTEVRTQLTQDILATPVHFLQPARHAGSGVTVNALSGPDDLRLLTGFFGDANGLRLITRNGTVKAKWDVAFSDYFPAGGGGPRPATDWNVDLHGSTILPDGSVIFNFEYYGAVKLDRCGAVEWTLPERSHHSVTVAEGGGFWIPGRRINGEYSEATFWPFSAVENGRRLQEDIVMRVSDDGKVLASKSVPELLYDNDLGALLTANGVVIDDDFPQSAGPELVHLNKIDELSTALAERFPEFEAGDLLLSLRTHNLLLVVDPDDWRVKWYRVGPWQRQHDPRFATDGTIHVFNNNAFVFELGPLNRAAGDAMAHSNIMAVDPASGATSVIYGQRADQHLSSVVRGAQQPMPDGGTLVTEHEAGRAFQASADGDVVWEYINRYDAAQVAEITGATAYPASYFEVADWTCPKAEAIRTTALAPSAPDP